MIGILGHSNDTHVQAVAWAVEECGVETRIIDTAASQAGLDGWEAKYPSRRGSSSIWGRAPTAVLNRKVAKAFYCPELGNAIDRSNVEQTTLQYMQEALSLDAIDVPYLNDPSRNAEASRKLVQLRLAPAFGFKVPVTFAGYLDWQSLDWAAEHIGRDVLFKPLRHNIWALDAGGYSFTSSVCVSVDQLRSLMQAQNHVRMPAILQQPVAKQKEYRVTCIGRELSVMAYWPAERTEEVDWRFLPPSATCYSKADLPHGAGRAILSMMEHFGLQLATFDLCEDSDGELYFLEINPTGQFLYCERLVPGLDLLRRITTCLLGYEHPAGAGCGALCAGRISLDGFLEARGEQGENAKGGNQALLDDILFPVSVSLKELMKEKSQNA